MIQRSRILLAGALAALALGAIVGSTSANRLSVNELRWTHRFAGLRFIAGTNTVTCAVTTEGSFHSAVSQKVMGALSGLITRASIGACTGGNASILRETLPWHIAFASFTGRLPFIETVKDTFIGESFRVQPAGSLACLGRLTTEHPGIGITSLGEEGTATELTAERGAEIPLTGEGGLCAFGGRGHFEGTGAITNAAGGALIVKLI